MIRTLRHIYLDNKIRRIWARHAARICIRFFGPVTSGEGKIREAWAWVDV
jgi:hypothetical protein